MQYRRYRYSTKFKGDGDETTVYAREVPHGYTLEVTHFTAGFITEEIEVWQLGYVNQAGDEFPLTMVDYAYLRYIHVPGRVWLEAGEKPYAKITSMKTTEEGFLSVHGRLWPTEEMIAKVAEVQQADDVPDNSKPQ